MMEIKKFPKPESNLPLPLDKPSPLRQAQWLNAGGLPNGPKNIS